MPIPRRLAVIAVATAALAIRADRASLSPRHRDLILGAAHADPAWRTRPVLTHSHNDYTQRHPLADALSNGFRSVEADIWLVDGEIWVSHLGFNLVGTLRELYLEPLREMIERRGAVYGDGEPLYLWLDIKTSEPARRPALHALL